MKLSNSFFYTIRENAKDEDSTSGNLLVRSGMIKKKQCWYLYDHANGEKSFTKD